MKGSILSVSLICFALVPGQARSHAAVRSQTTTKPRIVYRWDLQSSGVHDDLEAVFFLNPSLGWAAGKSNTILKTTDGGKTWKLLTERQEGGIEFRSVVFVSASEGWAASPKMLLHTSDGGDSWQPAAPLPGSQPGYGGGAVRGAVRYQMHTPTSGLGVYRSADGGGTWQLAGKPPRNDYEAVFFVDEQNGWLSGDYGRLARTLDGGATWTAEASPLKANFSKIQFVTPQVGWLLPIRGHAGGPLATTDGGKTWTSQYAGVERYRPLSDLQFLNEQDGFLLAEGNNSDSVYRTANGGKTWRTIGHLEKYSKTLSFPTLEEGWVVGPKGYIIHYHPVRLPQ